MLVVGTCFLLIDSDTCMPPLGAGKGLLYLPRLLDNLRYHRSDHRGIPINRPFNCTNNYGLGEIGYKAKRDAAEHYVYMIS